MPPRVKNVFSLEQGLPHFRSSAKTVRYFPSFYLEVRAKLASQSWGGLKKEGWLSRCQCHHQPSPVFIRQLQLHIHKCTPVKRVLLLQWLQQKAASVSVTTFRAAQALIKQCCNGIECSPVFGRAVMLSRVVQSCEVEWCRCGVALSGVELWSEVVWSPLVSLWSWVLPLWSRVEPGWVGCWQLTPLVLPLSNPAMHCSSYAMHWIMCLLKLTDCFYTAPLPSYGSRR